jgi:hypothetical protein
VKLFGPVHYGFEGIYDWQGSAGFTSSWWFTDQYLAQLQAESARQVRRLLDVYDLHWYSEARSTDSNTRVTDLNGTTLSAAEVQAIVQSPRSLWDATYTESSWISNDVLGGPIRLIPRLQAKLAAWPGTELAITEYNNGGANHVAGAVAQADNLGIFGATGVFAAALWQLTDSPYIYAAFHAFRDFDGAGASFGDTAIAATSSDTSRVAAYLSSDSGQAGRYVLVVVNRSAASQNVAFAGLPSASGTARVFRIDASGPRVVHVGDAPVASLSAWVLAVPALSVTTVEIR